MHRYGSGELPADWAPPRVAQEEIIIRKHSQQSMEIPLQQFLADINIPAGTTLAVDTSTLPIGDNCTGFNLLAQETVLVNINGGGWRTFPAGVTTLQGGLVRTIIVQAGGTFPAILQLQGV